MARGPRQRAPKRPRLDADAEPAYEPHEAASDTEPEWIAGDDANTPFGLVPGPVQTYFKEANAQLVQFAQQDADEEESSMLLQSILEEINGKELALSTDPQCSLVMENVCRHASEKTLRILLDRMTGSFFVLASHRYGSHVLQALLSSAQKCLDARADEPQSGDSTKDGTLRPLPQLVQDLFAELEPQFGTMIADTFASHVLQTLVYLLAGVRVEAVQELRSRRSLKYRAKERQRSAIDATPEDESRVQLHTPSIFFDLLRAFYEQMHGSLDDARLKMLSSDKIAAPCVSQLLLLENGLAPKRKPLSWKSDSLTVRVLGCERADAVAGDAAAVAAARSDYVESALRDAVASHVLESALRGASKHTLTQFWRVYLEGRVVKLGSHPCANHVVAAALRELPVDDDRSPFAQALQELTQAGDRLVKSRMLGVLQVAVERCAETQTLASDAMDAVRSAFRYPADAPAAAFVPVVLSLRTRKAYLHTFAARDGDGDGDGDEPRAPRKRRSKHDADDAFTTQGSVLLQCIARLPSPAQNVLYASLSHETPLLPMAQSPIAVHVLLASLASPSATFAQRKRLVGRLLPSLVALSDDLWGSRVADALWDAADGFTKVRHDRQTTR